MHVWRENVPRNTPEEMKYPSSSHSPQSLAFLSRIFATLTLVGLWTGCGHSSPANAQDTAKAHSSARAATLPPSREADDVARFFAGLPGTPGSPFADLEQTEAWKTHRNMLDQAWHKNEIQKRKRSRGLLHRFASGAAVRLLLVAALIVCFAWKHGAVEKMKGWLLYSSYCWFRFSKVSWVI